MIFHNFNPISAVRDVSDTRKSKRRKYIRRKNDSARIVPSQVRRDTVSFNQSRVLTKRPPYISHRFRVIKVQGIKILGTQLRLHLPYFLILFFFRITSFFCFFVQKILFFYDKIRHLLVGWIRFEAITSQVMRSNPAHQLFFIIKLENIRSLERFKVL